MTLMKICVLAFSPSFTFWVSFFGVVCEGGEKGMLGVDATKSCKDTSFELNVKPTHTSNKT